MDTLELGQAGLNEVAKRLSSISLSPAKGLHQPFTRVAYQAELDRNRPQFPEELLSLYHHPIYASLSAEQKWKLGLLETINFFSINIHGERKLVQGLEERLYVPSRFGGSWDIGDYLQHFIHEENAHTHMLAGYCYRYGDGVMKDYAIQVEEPRLSDVGAELLFFGRVFVLEMFLDYLNTNAMRDERLDVTVRQIHRFHHDEEARHMAFDREVIECCVKRAEAAGLHDEMKLIAKLLDDYGRVAVKSLYSPVVYKKIGIKDPTVIAQEAQAIPQRVKVENAWRANARAFLDKMRLSVH
ncbi:diiron oxygenase [Trinickia sp. YCB016]